MGQCPAQAGVMPETPVDWSRVHRFSKQPPRLGQPPPGAEPSARAQWPAGAPNVENQKRPRLEPLAPSGPLEGPRSGSCEWPSRFIPSQTPSSADAKLITVEPSQGCQQTQSPVSRGSMQAPDDAGMLSSASLLAEPSGTVATPTKPTFSFGLYAMESDCFGSQGAAASLQPSEASPLFNGAGVSANLEKQRAESSQQHVEHSQTLWGLHACPENPAVKRPRAESQTSQVSVHTAGEDLASQKPLCLSLGFGLELDDTTAELLRE